jgi:hypothetical protein
MVESGRTILNESTWQEAYAMRDSLLRHKKIKGMLDTSTAREVTIVWARDGQLCKARIDAMGANWAGDWKTTNNLRGFSPRVVEKYGLHRQASWYLEGLKANGIPDVSRFFWPTVGNYLPFEAVLYECESDSIAVGTEELDKLWRKWLDCKTNDRWPTMFGDEIVKAGVSDRRYNDTFNLDADDDS